MSDSDSDSDKRHSIVARMLPDDWDQRPFSVATELRSLLSTLKDEGTSIDSGSGDGCADLWVTIGGVEYFISIRPSNKHQQSVGGLYPEPPNAP